MLDTENATQPALTEPKTRDRAASKGGVVDVETWITLGIFAACAVLILSSHLISPAFGGWDQTRAILVLSSFVMVAGFGQGLVILLGGLDLSVASVMTLGGVLIFTWAGSSTANLVWAFPVVVVVTAFVGAANGFGITYFRVPPFIMTMASGLIVYGVCLGFTQGTPRGEASPLLAALFTHMFGGVPFIIYVMIAVAVAGTALQSRTPFGRKLYALGGSEVAAYIAGIAVRRLTITTYAIAGASSGVAGVMMVGYAGGATLTMGQAYLLPSIAAVVIGGTSILGGRGTYLGTVGGSILLTTISTIISALAIAEGWRTVINGAVILIAVLLMREQVFAWFERASRTRKSQLDGGHA